MMVDFKSYELAEHFLSEVKGATTLDVKELASAIQALCEARCNEVEDRRSTES